jgi:hypothetical protein
MLLPSPLQLLPLLAHHLHRRSCRFHCHCPRNRRLIAVSKSWVIATAAAMAVLMATVLGDCGGSSSNEDGCHNSRGEDNGNGGNGVGDDCPCRPCNACFVPATLLPTPLPVLLLWSFYLSACNEEGDGKGSKSIGNGKGNSNGNGNEEGDGGRRQQEQWRRQ